MILLVSDLVLYVAKISDQVDNKFIHSTERLQSGYSVSSNEAVQNDRDALKITLNLIQGPVDIYVLAHRSRSSHRRGKESVRIMKYLVTGGSGFIGSHLVGRLLETDAEKVIAIDLWLSDLLMEYQGLDSFEFVHGDILDSNLLNELCGKVDIVYHFASILGTSETVDIYDSEMVTETNIVGTLRVLKASRAQSVNRVIYPSTPDVPWLNPYKITKAACERFCQMFFEEYGLETVVLALPNVYGSGERWLDCAWGAPYNYQKVIPTFILKALKNEPLPVYGDGSQKAIYMHVDDAVRAMQYAAKRKDCEGQVIPIGPDTPISVRDLANLIRDLTTSRSELQYLPMRSGEFKVDITVDPKEAATSLGFTPEIDLITGLKYTIPFYESLGG